MPACHFSNRAEADLQDIGAWTLSTWGIAQTTRYLEELQILFTLLAENPAMGRSCHQVRPGLRRMEHGRHVIFYRNVKDGILVSRLLHIRMLPHEREFDDPGA